MNEFVYWSVQLTWKIQYRDRSKKTQPAQMHIFDCKC